MDFRTLPEYKQEFELCKNMSLRVLNQGLDMHMETCKSIEAQISSLQIRYNQLMAKRIAICDLKRKKESNGTKESA